MRLGDHLLEFLARAQKRVLLVAPFMKMAATERVLRAVPAIVQDITLVTRWHADEVVAGVSDLEVFDLVRTRHGARLFLHPRLHAKLYQADGQSLVGSANLTDMALGWTTLPNLELLLRQDPADGALDAFLKVVFEGAYEATAAIRDAVAAETAGLPRTVEPLQLAANWLPSCASPERLFNVYADIDLFRLTESAFIAGRSDLAALKIPAGLAEGPFHQFLTVRMAEMPLVQHIMEKLSTGMTDSAGVALMQAELRPEQLPYGDAMMAWEILKRWLKVFGGGAFRSRSTGEELIRGRQL